MAEPAPPATAVPEEITDAMGVLMRFVPAGEFFMGSDLAEHEMPPARVYLNAFYIDKYEVTNRVYKLCVDAGVCRPPSHEYRNSSNYANPTYFGNPEYDNYPVIYAAWQMANAFCAWRGGRLPTEAECEKAARGTDGLTYPLGERAACEYANIFFQGDQCDGDTTEVGIYAAGASPYGLFDTAGNVVEWTSTLSKPYPYNAADGREDPEMPDPGLSGEAPGSMKARPSPGLPGATPWTRPPLIPTLGYELYPALFPVMNRSTGLSVHRFGQ